MEEKNVQEIKIQEKYLNLEMFLTFILNLENCFKAIDISCVNAEYNLAKWEGEYTPDKEFTRRKTILPLTLASENWMDTTACPLSRSTP